MAFLETENCACWLWESLSHVPGKLSNLMTVPVRLQFWQTIMASGLNQVNIGAIFKGSSPQNFYPRAITVNGNPCYIQQLR